MTQPQGAESQSQNATGVFVGESQVAFSKHPTPRPFYFWFPASFAQRLVLGGRELVWRVAILQYQPTEQPGVTITKTIGYSIGKTRAEAVDMARVIVDAVNRVKGESK